MVLAVLGFVASLRGAPVRGASMEPTLEDGQWIWYHTLPTLLPGLQRGQIVVFRSPVAPGHRYVKRLVGLPGDELRFSNGGLEVNGAAMELPPGAVPMNYRLATRVPEDCFFALGDHGKVSLDSRRFGPVPMDHLIGLVVPPTNLHPAPSTRAALVAQRD